MKNKKIAMLFIALIVFALTVNKAFANSDDLESHKHSIVYVKNVFEINGILKNSNGTGFFIDSTHVMTVSHAIHIDSEAKEKYIRLYFQESPTYRTNVDATVVYDDPINDVAILKVVDWAISLITDKIEPLNLADETPNIDDSLTIIGFPHDSVKTSSDNTSSISTITSDSTYSVSKGKLKEKNYYRDQTLATNKVRGGYSGSPVLNENGYVVGLERAKIETDEAVFVPLDVLIKDIKECIK